LRVLLFTGKGGVGKSTLAASTAALAAASGRRTLVLSTDAAHSLADAFGATVGAEPTQVAPNLYVEQVDAQLRFEQSWADIQRYLLSVLDVAGMDPVAAEELTVIPGAEEVLALLELRLRARSGDWDLIVVDCAPTAETLRLLALPEALGWYMARVFPMQRRLVKALKPVLTRAAGVPMPGETVFDALQRLHDELLEVRDLLTGPEASVRLVLTPETVVVAEARRSYTMLSLYGYRVDGVVANRVFPSDGADDWRAGWVLAQDEVLADVDASFPGLPVWRSVYRPREPVGVPALEALAEEVYAGQEADPLAPPSGDGPFRVTRTATGAVARLALPGATKDQVHLARNGDDLVVTVGSYRRLMTLPQGLARLSIAGARVEVGELQVRFMEGSARSDAGSAPEGRGGRERQ
jgi:arsenite/tail-anchored protein-transporting ATPase